MKIETLRLPKSYWDFDRFGLTPRKVWARISNRREPKIFSVSIPKAGTHLLERALCLHPRLYRKLLPKITDENVERYGGMPRLLEKLRPGEVLLSHLYYDDAYIPMLQRMGIRTIFMVRDPRDIVVSDTFFIWRWSGHPLHDFFRSQGDIQKCLRIAIEGYPPLRYPSIAEKLERFSGWLRPEIHLLRFEDLVGPHGGGRQETQIQTLERLYEFLGLPLDPATRQWILSQLVSKRSPTFRKGQTRQWEAHFTRELLNLFENLAGHWLEVYGYV